MIQTHVTATHIFYVAYFKGIPVKIVRDRKTGKILFNAESVAACLGFDSTQDMMSQDVILEAISQYQQENNGDSPLRQMDKNGNYI